MYDEELDEDIDFDDEDIDTDDEDIDSDDEDIDIDDEDIDSDDEDIDSGDEDIDTDDEEELNEEEFVKAFREYGLDFPMKVGKLKIDMENAKWFRQNASLLDTSYESLAYRLADLVAEVLEIYKNGGEIYRFIFIDSENDIDKKSIGESWTTDNYLIDDPETMEVITMDRNPVMYGKKYVAKLTARIPPRCINTGDSIENRMTYPQEMEIVIPKWNWSSLRIMDVSISENEYYNG